MNHITFTKPEIIKKGWGREEVIANNDKYCGKLLVYEKSGAVSSRHLHYFKQEHFKILDGVFNFFYYDCKGNLLTKKVISGDIIEIPAGCPHQLECVEPGTIFEVSTPHSDEDVIRIAPGDSQRNA